MKKKNPKTKRPPPIISKESNKEKGKKKKTMTADRNFPNAIKNSNKINKFFTSEGIGVSRAASRKRKWIGEQTFCLFTGFLI